MECKPIVGECFKSPIISLINGMLSEIIQGVDKKVQDMVLERIREVVEHQSAKESCPHEGYNVSLEMQKHELTFKFRKEKSPNLDIVFPYMQTPYAIFMGQKFPIIYNRRVKVHKVKNSEKKLYISFDEDGIQVVPYIEENGERSICGGMACIPYYITYKKNNYGNKNKYVAAKIVSSDTAIEVRLANSANVMNSINAIVGDIIHVSNEYPLHEVKELFNRVIEEAVKGKKSIVVSKHRKVLKWFPYKDGKFLWLDDECIFKDRMEVNESDPNRESFIYWWLKDILEKQSIIEK